MRGNRRHRGPRWSQLPSVPRMRGNLAQLVVAGAALPSSPAHAGNHSRARGLVRTPPSSPAHAGRPPPARSATGENTFKPRASGGTPKRSKASSARYLQAPRMRGNLSHLLRDRKVVTSSPARAGRPRSQACGQCSDSFKPRTCGETGDEFVVVAGVVLQSPRMRGNLTSTSLPVVRRPSSPAHAGKPG